MVKQQASLKKQFEEKHREGESIKKQFEDTVKKNSDLEKKLATAKTTAQAAPSAELTHDDKLGQYRKRRENDNKSRQSKTTQLF